MVLNQLLADSYEGFENAQVKVNKQFLTNKMEWVLKKETAGSSDCNIQYVQL